VRPRGRRWRLLRRLLLLLQGDDVSRLLSTYVGCHPAGFLVDGFKVSHYVILKFSLLSSRFSVRVHVLSSGSGSLTSNL
jgi:hypothetical protein